MKHYIYTSVLADERLTHREKIIYSYLVYQSFWYKAETSKEKQELKEGADATQIAASLRYQLPIDEIHAWEISNDLDIPKRTVYDALAHLKTCGLIYKDDYGCQQVKIGDDTFESYFRLVTEYGLEGVALIVFSYIYHINNTFQNPKLKLGNIARALHIKQSALTFTLRKLVDSGYISMNRHWKSTNFIVY